MRMIKKLNKATTRLAYQCLLVGTKLAFLPNLQQNRKNALDTPPKHCHIKGKKKALTK